MEIITDMNSFTPCACFDSNLYAKMHNLYGMEFTIFMFRYPNIKVGLYHCFLLFVYYMKTLIRMFLKKKARKSGWISNCFSTSHYKVNKTFLDQNQLIIKKKSDHFNRTTFTIRNIRNVAT